MKLEATCGVLKKVASATGLMWMKPPAETPQALVGGAAPAGMAAATTAPPISASDPATLTALLRIRFTVSPSLVVVSVQFRLLAERVRQPSRRSRVPAGQRPCAAGTPPRPSRDPSVTFSNRHGAYSYSPHS